MGPLKQKYPDYHPMDVSDFYQEIDTYRKEQDVKRKARIMDALSLDMITRASQLLINEETTADATDILKGLRAYFKENPLVLVGAAKKKIEALSKDHKKEADGLLKAMMDLYKDNPEALKLLQNE